MMNSKLIYHSKTLLKAQNFLRRVWLNIKMENRYFFSLVLFISILSFLTNISATTTEECENGGGTWTIPDIVIPSDEPTKSKLNSYCSCEIGLYWNDTSKECMDDSQLRCIQTQGEWVNDACQCPEGTIKWTPGFGCDTKGPVPTSDGDLNELNNKGAPYSLNLVIILLILLILSTILILNRKKSKQNENK